MAPRYIFHLSIPVSELSASRQFYVEVLGATVGRENEDWLSDPSGNVIEIKAYRNVQKTLGLVE